MTHFDQEGAAVMVDITDKALTRRIAQAGGYISMQPETLKAIAQGTIAKGDILGVARLAGLMAAKRTSELIPLCHPLPLSAISIDFTLDEACCVVEIIATCKLIGQTGAEMEALSAVSIAALTIYDMCKAIDKTMIIGNIRLLHKSGGKSGTWSRMPESSTG